jgi:hypothetical protein
MHFIFPRLQKKDFTSVSDSGMMGTGIREATCPRSYRRQTDSEEDYYNLGNYSAPPEN